MLYYYIMAESNDTSFYTIVVVIALIVLIVVLVFLALQIQDAKDEKPFPPTQSTCPDYWDTNGTLCNVPPFGSEHPNMGSIRDSQGNLLLSTNNTSGLNLMDNPISIDMSDELWTSGGTALCSKKQWTNTYGIEWDGVSNYNGCN